MEEVDKAWLAAAIDGEGSISLPNGKPRITVTNNNREFLEKVHRLFGCDVGVGISARHQKEEYKSLTYIFVVSRRDLIQAVLPQIIPYMIVKKSNAIEMMNWFATRKYDVSKTDVTGKTMSGKKGGSSGRNGNWGNSEAHRTNALMCKNNHLKGNWGNSEEHSRLAHLAWLKRKST